MQKGADVNSENDQMYRTPLLAACENDNLEMIDFLLRSGASPCGVDKDKKMAFPLAAVCSVQAAGLLLDAGADVDEQNMLGQTALMGLASKEDETLLPVAELLLARGATPSLKNRFGQTALDMVKTGGMAGLLAATAGAGDKPENLGELLYDKADDLSEEQDFLLYKHLLAKADRADLAFEGDSYQPTISHKVLGGDTAKTMPGHLPKL